MEPIETFIKQPHFVNGRWNNGYKLEIYLDDDPVDPREEFSNVGKMICFHRKYRLGGHHGLTIDCFGSWQEVKEFIIDMYGAVVVLPIYMYEHSGITISTEPFSCSWDSGQIGFIYADMDDLQDYNGDKTKLTNALIDEVKEYDNYLTGNVYGYKLYEMDDNGKWEQMESCWGFYGDYKCILDEYGVKDDD